MTRDRLELLAAVAAAAVVAGPFALFGDGVDFPDDALYYEVTAWEWLRAAVRTDQSIWWMTGKLGGVSLFGDVTPMGPLYPFAWLGVVLPVVPAMGLAVLVHAVGTLLAVRWMATVHGASARAATLAGAAIVLGPLGSAAFVDAQVDSWPAFLWIPVVLGALERGATTEGRTRRRWLAAAAVALGLLLLGTHLRVAVGACGVIAVWTLLRARDLPGAALAAAAGLLIGSPGFVPMLLEAGLATGGGTSSRTGLSGPIDQALGLHAVGGWLAPTVMSVARDVSLGTVLGIAALAAFADDRRAGAAVILCVLAGTHLPGVKVALAPLLLLSHPVNLVWPVLALIPAAVLAARGLDRLLAMTADERRAFGQGPAGAVVAIMVAAAVARVALGEFASEHGRTLQVLSTAQAAAVLVVAWRLLGRGRADLVFAVVLADLLLFGVRAHLAVPSTPLVASADAYAGDVVAIEDGFLDLWDLADTFQTPGSAEEDDVVVPELDGPAMQADLGGRAWPPHLPLALGTPGLAGKSKLTPARQAAALRPLAEALHANRGVEYFFPELFAPGGLGAATMALHGIPAAAWKDIAAYRVEDVAPLCSFARRVEVVEDADLRMRRLLETTAPWTARTSLVEAPVTLPDPTLPPEHLSCPEPGITDVSTSSGALVIRRVRWHPGWRVTDETGAHLDTFPLNQVHTGVVVGPGTSRLTYRFVPPGLRGSLLASLAGVALALLLAFGRRRRPTPSSSAAAAAASAVTASILAAGLGVALLPRAANAASIEGTVESWSADAGYEVLLVGTLDLAQPPLATASVTPETGAFRVDVPRSASGDGWLFLHQTIDPAVGAPISLHLPFDLDPFDLAAPPDRVRIRGVAPMLAELRARDEPLPGWWLMPLVLCLWLGIGCLLGRQLVKWRLQMVVGARALLAIGRRTGGTDRGSAPATRSVAQLLGDDGAAAPRAGAAPPPAGPRERAAVLGLVVVALLLRLRGLFGSSFDLLEHTYGPGSRPLEAEPLAALEAVVAALLRPSAVEVTHPPVYHWLLSAMGAVSEAEWFLRLPALIASLATVVVVWRLFRRLHPAGGVAAAALYAVVAPAVHFGADATPYAFSALVAVGSLELLARALESGSARDWRRWGGLLALGFLCHYSVALFGLAQAGTVVVLAVMRARRTAWLLALHRAFGAALVVAPLPMAWCFVHFAWYDPVALDTRLFASSYAPDPGLTSFAAQFFAVSVGVAPSDLLSAAAFGVLVLAGLVGAGRRDRELALLLLGSVAAFVAGTAFFHGNLVSALDGRVFWGFRWVSWVLPLAMGLAAYGAVAAVQASPRGGTVALVALVGIWASAAVPFTANLPSHTTRPDYAGAAARIVAELNDRDAIATLPLWGQRGPLAWYLAEAGDGRFGERPEGGDGWDFGGKRLYAEATFEDLPFETSARNAWFDRLWVVVVDERVFGKPKFSLDVASRAVEWAREHMTVDAEWSADGLAVYRFVRPPGDLLLDDAVTLEPPEVSVGALRYLEPNLPGCREGRWELTARVPLRPGAGQPVVTRAEATVVRRDDAGHWTATVTGGPCSAPPPRVELRNVRNEKRRP